MHSFRAISCRLETSVTRTVAEVETDLNEKVEIGDGGGIYLDHGRVDRVRSVGFDGLEDPDGGAYGIVINDGGHRARGSVSRWATGVGGM
jgi:hypothetical protein